MNLKRIYGARPVTPIDGSEKNPNRVTSGIKAAGGHKTVLMDDLGNPHEVPTIRYIESLEKKIDNLRNENQTLKASLNRVIRSQNTVIDKLNGTR